MPHHECIEYEVTEDYTYTEDEYCTVRCQHSFRRMRKVIEIHCFGHDDKSHAYEQNDRITFRLAYIVDNHAKDQ